ncbi:MAG: SurA N-terminal domain-containing protein [Rickettsiaceae bacterium]|nr:SurA N-terminal domain-containing protein [Rickettsiaceae bacterium]
MLHKLRQFQNSIAAKIFLTLIASAFILASISEVITSSSDANIVTFAKLNNIKFSEFAQMRNRLLGLASNELGPENTLDENTKKEVSSMAISMMIKKSLVNKLIEDLDISIGDRLIASRIKTWPIFFNEQKKFDVEIYKNYMASNHVPKKIFFNEVKYEISEYILNSLVLDMTPIPQLYTKIIEQNKSLVKNYELVYINLEEQNTIAKPTPSKKELREFYDTHLELFTKEEVRHVNYIAINFNNQEGSSAIKNDTQKIATSTKSTLKKKASSKELTRETNTNISYPRAELENILRDLQDLVSSGATLEEISAKYQTSIEKFKGNKLQLLSNNILKKFANEIFTGKELEISYPHEGEKQNYLIIFQVKAKDPAGYFAFKDVQKMALDLYTKDYYKKHNLIAVQEFGALAKQSFLELLAREKKYKFAYKSTRSLDSEDNNVSQIEQIIEKSTLKGVSDPIFIDNMAYIYKIYSTNEVKISPKQLLELRENINNNFFSMILTELLEYYYSENDPKINEQLLNKGL